MANRKKQVYKPKPMTEGKRNLIQGLLQEYDIQSADDIQEALKDLLSGTIQDMLETEMDRLCVSFILFCDVDRMICNIPTKEGGGKQEIYGC